MTRPITASDCDVAVIGAGPYGLALTSHLRAAGIDALVFGEVMGFWRNHAPQGMRLVTPLRETHIAAPRGRLRIDDFLSAGGTAQPDLLTRDDFIGYGEWFAGQAAIEPDPRRVERIEAANGGFTLGLSSGAWLRARRVVIATGLAGHDYRPPVFGSLPRDLVSHTCEHTNFERYRRRRIGVIGRGQGACESAALLREAGAQVQIICRGPIRWTDEGADRGFVRGLLSPEAPWLMHRLPADLREAFGARGLSPSAARWTESRMDDVGIVSGRQVRAARRAGERAALTLKDGVWHFDHVLLATGYRVDIARSPIFAHALLERIDCQSGSPILSRNFESSVPGLHFIGAAAIASFGPLMNRIAGTDFAARRVTQAALAGNRSERRIERRRWRGRGATAHAGASRNRTARAA